MYKNLKGEFTLVSDKSTDTYLGIRTAGTKVRVVDYFESIIKTSWRSCGLICEINYRKRVDNKEIPDDNRVLLVNLLEFDNQLQLLHESDLM